MRLIDADAYCAAMKERQDAVAAWRDDIKAGGGVNTELWYRAEQALATFVEAKLTLDKIPTVDAVPVVRCGECLFWNRDHISCEGLARCATGESGVRYRNKYDFCSRGERKEQDE